MSEACRRASDRRSPRQRSAVLRPVEPLEPRVLLALPPGPVITPPAFFGFTGSTGFTTDLLTFNTQLSTPGPGGAPTTVRIEAPPLNSNFGVNNLYAIVRTGSQPGLIYRIDGASGNINGTGPNGTFQPLGPFSALPPQAIGGSLGTDAPATDPPTGYDNFFDLVFDPTGTYPGGLFVSTSDKFDLNRNAIYAFDAQGNLLNAGRANPAGQGTGLPFATFPERNFPPQTIFDNNPGPLAFGGGGPFGTGLYAQDVTKKQGTADSNVLFSIAPDGTRTIALDHIEDLLPPPPTPPATPPGPPDFDARGIIFGPSNFGAPTALPGINTAPVIAPSGQFGGDLFEASSDLEETKLSRVIQIEKAPLGNNPNVFTVNDLLPATLTIPTDTGLYSDIAAEPGINFGGGLFITEMLPSGMGQVVQVTQDFTKPFNPQAPTATFLITNIIATGFKTRPYVAGDIASQAAAENESFSITFSADDQRMYVSDETGIYEVRPTGVTVASSDAGQLVGLADLRDLGVPYDGQGLAFAVKDTGVEAAQPVFGGHVAPGFQSGTGGPGTSDVIGHGTAVASIIHQYVPQATIVPVQDEIGTNATTLNGVQSQVESEKYIADHPVVIDPLTGKIVPIVAVNNSNRSTLTFDTEVNAYKDDKEGTISEKIELQRMRDENIAFVSSAGNSGLEDPNAMEGMPRQAILNEAISVIASYGFPFDRNLSTSPLDPVQGTIDVAGNVAQLPIGCMIADGDLVVFKDKIAAFSNRSIQSDFAAPGVCIRAFTPINFTGLEPPGFTSNFTGTSAAAPNLTGQFMLTRSAVEFWSAVAQNPGAVNSPYLTSPVGHGGDFLDLRGTVDLSAYKTEDGINSILQWTAVPVTDKDLIVEDMVAQEFLRDTHRYRTYARADVGNAIAAIEGTEAIRFFQANGGVAQLDPDHDGRISADDIEAYVQNPSIPANFRAMARLLGGTDSGPEARRFQFFDFAARGFEVGSITYDELNQLGDRLLPPPDAFPVTDRYKGANEGFLLQPKGRRAYIDLTKVLPSQEFLTAFLSGQQKQNISHLDAITPINFGGHHGIGIEGPGSVSSDKSPAAPRGTGISDVTLTNPVNKTGGFIHLERGPVHPVVPANGGVASDQSFDATPFPGAVNDGIQWSGTSAPAGSLVHGRNHGRQTAAGHRTSGPRHVIVRGPKVPKKSAANKGLLRSVGRFFGLGGDTKKGHAKVNRRAK